MYSLLVRSCRAAPGGQQPFESLQQKFCFCWDSNLLELKNYPEPKLWCSKCFQKIAWSSIQFVGHVEQIFFPFYKPRHRALTGATRKCFLFQKGLDTNYLALRSTLIILTSFLYPKLQVFASLSQYTLFWLRLLSSPLSHHLMSPVSFSYSCLPYPQLSYQNSCKFTWVLFCQTQTDQWLSFLSYLT